MPSHDVEDERSNDEGGVRAAGTTPEEREREQAWRRGKDRARGITDARAADAWRDASATAARAFVALAENVRDYAIFLMNPEGIITFWGEGARLIKWWTKEEAEGAHLRMLYPSGGAEDGTAEEHIRLAAAHGEYTGEGCRLRSDGSTFWAGVTLTALRDGEGRLLGFAKVTRDLTARHAADAMLQAASAAASEARAAAEAANEAKSGFLATMSHEIRTPVNAIMGYLDLLSLEIGGPLTSEQRSYVDRAARGSRHLLSLVSEVLDFSRLEARRTPLERRAFRVGDAVTHALGLIAPQARARGVEIADSVSGHAGGLSAWGDEARTAQIVVNLLVNAVKFTDPGLDERGRITISAGIAGTAAPDVRLPGEGPWVYIRVEDTGAGIAPDQIERIFEPFVQADMSLTRGHGGTGLGLAISRRLARAMDGDVVARSTLGVGSTFFLWLPAAPVESMQTGGVEGSGPFGEAAAVSTSMPDAAQAHETTEAISHSRLQPGSLRAMAELLLGEMERILAGFTARMRADPGVPAAHGVEVSQVEDHFASFIADVAGTLANVDAELGAPADALGDGTAIQRVIAERHGAQRARLGWDEAQLRREFGIFREELEAALKRGAPIRLPAPTAQARLAEAARAMELVARFVDVAEGVGVEALRRTLAEGGAGSP
jgi:PAS domain S-box-containing protein